MVTSDERVLDGTPVVGGTRIPVRAVAAMLEESSPAQVLEAFPMLSAHQVELCGLYAQAWLTGATSPRRAALGLPMVAVERVRRKPPPR